MAAIASDPTIKLVIYPHSMAAQRPSTYNDQINAGQTAVLRMQYGGCSR